MEGTAAQAAPAKLKLLDTFAGIGGNSYAFHSFTDTILYCEISEKVTPILRSVMTKGFISTAPIFPDITKLDKEEVMKHTDTVDMLNASWPCQDNSKLGSKRGMDGERSGLIRDVIRLTGELQPKIVFLENVPDVLANGSVHFVIEELVKLGYKIGWGIVSAANCGFRQLRERCFIVAVLQGHEQMLQDSIAISETHTLARQTDEPVRMSHTLHPNRQAALGNTVCPQAVKLAFELIGKNILNKPSGQIIPADLKGLHLYPWGYHNGISVSVPPPTFPTFQFAPITLRADSYVATKPPSTRMTNPIVEQRTISLWTTPRHGNYGASQYFTKRSTHDLGSQVRFATCTTGPRNGYTNAQWLEWLMGYPADYTSH